MMGFLGIGRCAEINRLTLENEMLKKMAEDANHAVQMALNEIDHTHELIRDFMDRLNSIMEAVEKKNGDD